MDELSYAGDIQADCWPGRETAAQDQSLHTVSLDLAWLSFS